MVQANGKIVVAGGRGNDLFVARFTARGAPDAGFGTGGLSLAAELGRAASLALQQNGHIVAAGDDGGQDFVVARFRP